MDVFEGQYFNFNRKLFVFMGLWPYGSRMKNVRKYLLLLTLLCFSVPPVISIGVNFSDVDRVMLNLVEFFIAFLMFLKVLAMIAAEDKMKGIYRKIADNWLSITDEKEKEILAEYSERGMKKTIFYFALVEVGASTIFVLPAVPKILDLVSPLPNPRQRIHISEIDLLIDREMHYWLYFFWDATSIVVFCTVSVSVDTMFIVCIEHCCALYAIIRYRMRNLKSQMVDNLSETGVDTYDYIMGIVKLHQNALGFVKTTNRAFSMLFLYILFANFATLPLEAVTIIANLHKPFNCIRFGMLLLLLGVHLFMLFWPGQNVLDQSTELIDDAYCNEWYETSLRTRKMIIVFMIRCTRPAILTAGGLMLMNFETFAMIVRTAISYITVVASFRSN